MTRRYAIALTAPSPPAHAHRIAPPQAASAEMIPQRLIVSGPGQVPAKNREQWLTEVAVSLRPWFAERGYQIPLRVRLGVGALAENHRTLGVCHCAGDRDGFRHITISPFIDDPILVAAVLTHELIHAMLPPDEGHGRRFKGAARAVGFEGRVSGVQPGAALRAHLHAITRRAGPYPHKAVITGDGDRRARRLHRRLDGV